MFYKLLQRLGLIQRPNAKALMYRLDAVRVHNTNAVSALNAIPDSIQARRLRFHLTKQLDLLHKIEEEYQNGKF